MNKKVTVTLAIFLSILMAVLYVSNKNEYDFSVKNQTDLKIDWVEVNFDTGFRPPVGILAKGASKTSLGLTQLPKNITIKWKVQKKNECINIIFNHGYPKGFPGKISSLMSVNFLSKDKIDVIFSNATRLENASWGNGHSAQFPRDFVILEFNKKYKVEQCSQNA